MDSPVSHGAVFPAVGLLCQSGDPAQRAWPVSEESRDSNRFAIRVVLAVANVGHDHRLRLCLCLCQGTSRSIASDCCSESEPGNSKIVNNLHHDAFVVFVLSADVFRVGCGWQSLVAVEF